MITGSISAFVNGSMHTSALIQLTYRTTTSEKNEEKVAPRSRLEHSGTCRKNNAALTPHEPREIA